MLHHRLLLTACLLLLAGLFPSAGQAADPAPGLEKLNIMNDAVQAVQSMGMKRGDVGNE